jgi:hypothetical protein
MAKKLSHDAKTNRIQDPNEYYYTFFGFLPPGGQETSSSLQLMILLVGFSIESDNQNRACAGENPR